MGWLHTTGRKADLPNRIVVDPFGGVGRPNLEGMIYPDARYATYAGAGFGRNELVYACIMKKARTLPQSVLRVYGQRREEPLEDHRLRRLIAQPNPVTNEVQFLQLAIVHLDLAGQCFWLINRARDGVPAELWPIRPDLVRILPSQTGNPRDWRYGYVVDPPNATPRNVAVIPVDQRDMVHIKYPNPLDPYFGQAPMRPATRAVSVDNARTDYVDALLRNDAVPRVVIRTQDAIDDQVVSMLTDRWMRRHGGENRGRPAFLQAGMEVETLGLDLEQLQFGDLSGTDEARICMSFGVQPIVVGAKVGLDRSTFSNFREAMVDLWETTLMDLHRLFIAGIRTQILPFFLGVGRDRVDIRWDTSEVLALQEAESERWERATNALSRGGITRNMFLRTVGLDPVPGGDVFLTPAGVTPTPADGADGAPEPVEEGGPAGGGRTLELVEAASYAEQYLRQLADRPSSSNGQHRPAGSVAK